MENYHDINQRITDIMRSSFLSTPAKDLIDRKKVPDFFLRFHTQNKYFRKLKRRSITVSNDAEFIYDEKDLAQWRAAAKEYNYDLSVFGNVIFLRIKEADKLITEIQREREKKFADSKPYLKGQFIAQIQKKRKGLTPKFGKIYEENQIKNIENTHEFKEKVRMEKEHFDAVLDSVIALLGDIKVFYKRMFERIEAHIKAMEIQIRKIEIKPNPGVAGRGMQHLAQALRAVVGGRRGDNF